MKCTGDAHRDWRISINSCRVDDGVRVRGKIKRIAH